MIVLTGTIAQSPRLVKGLLFDEVHEETFGPFKRLDNASRRVLGADPAVGQEVQNRI